MPAVAKKNKKVKAAAPAASKKEDIPAVSEQVKKQLKKSAKKAKAVNKQRGVLFIKHLPHGFFEDQLKGYFEQFGEVTRLRLARSRKTGGSKGYAFVEFQFPEVAQIAAETMDNYLMFQRIVKAAYIPPEQQKFNYFQSKVRKVTNKVGKNIYVSGHTFHVNNKVKEYNKSADDKYEKRAKANLKKLKKLQEKFSEAGIDFEKLALQPKLASKEEQQEKSESDEEQAAGKLLLVKKRKGSVSEGASNAVAKKQKGNSKEIPLKSLLEKTLDEENSSEDEDFDAEAEALDGNESESSNEESYGIELGSDDEIDELQSEEEEEEDDEEDFTPPPKKKFGKPTKPQKGERLEQLIRRKPNLGAIKKPAKKTLKETKAPAAVKVAAAKEITKQSKVKPLKKVDLKKNKKKIAT